MPILAEQYEQSFPLDNKLSSHNGAPRSRVARQVSQEAAERGGEGDRRQVGGAGGGERRGRGKRSGVWGETRSGGKRKGGGGGDRGDTPSLLCSPERSLNCPLYVSSLLFSTPGPGQRQLCLRRHPYIQIVSAITMQNNIQGCYKASTSHLQLTWKLFARSMRTLDMRFLSLLTCSTKWVPSHK